MGDSQIFDESNVISLGVVLTHTYAVQYYSQNLDVSTVTFLTVPGVPLDTPLKIKHSRAIY